MSTAWNDMWGFEGELLDDGTVEQLRRCLCHEMDGADVCTCHAEAERVVMRYHDGVWKVTQEQDFERCVLAVEQIAQGLSIDVHQEVIEVLVVRRATVHAASVREVWVTDG